MPLVFYLLHLREMSLIMLFNYSRETAVHSIKMDCVNYLEQDYNHWNVFIAIMIEKD